MSSSASPSRRRLLAAAALAPLSAQLLGACASRPASPTPSRAGSTAPDDASPQATPESAALSEVTGSLPYALSACDELGAALLAHCLEANPRSNALASPLSLSLILALLADGAADPMAQGYDAALGSLGAERDRTWSAIQTSVRRNNRDLKGFSPEDAPLEPLVHLANHVVLIDGVEAETAYLEAVQHWYSAEVEQVARASAQADLDTWASAHTAGLIPESGVVVDDSTRLVLQNALLFAARWQVPFLPESTSTQPFTLDDGTSTEASFMYDTQELRYAQGEGWEAVRLPYRGGQEDPQDPDNDYTPALVLDVILPSTGTLPAQMGTATWATASAALDTAPPAQVELYLPKADLAPSAVDLMGFLNGLGLDTTNLDGISPGLSLAQITQQIRLTMDEEGTVAAALTEAGVAVAAPLETGTTVTLSVDRPFVVRLRDLVSGITLLEVAIMDPTAKNG